MRIPRYLDRFVGADAQTFTFPKKAYSLDDAQPLRNSLVAIAGGSYVVDQRGTAPGLKDPRHAAHHMAIVVSTTDDGTDFDVDVQEMRQKLYRGGLGQLYTKDGEGAAERWAYARIGEMPATNWRAGDLGYLPASLAWIIESDFFSATPFDTSFNIDADPKTISVVNPGDASAYDAILTLKGPFTNPSITNALNGYAISTTRDGSGSTKWLRIEPGIPRVRYSADSGATWAGDYALVTLPSLQIQLFVIEPGAQNVVVTGANGGVLQVQFQIPWE
jgi:hypothetical protein